MQLDLEAFLWKYSDQQISHIGPINPEPLLGYVTDNAGKATLYGLNSDIRYALTSNDLAGLAVEYLHTRYDSFVYTGLSFIVSPASTGCPLTPTSGPFVTVDCTGKPLVRSPEWSGNAFYQHRFDLAGGASIAFGARTQFSSKYFTTVDYLPLGTQGSFTDSSADLTYRTINARWSLTAYVQNIENKDASVGAYQYNYAPVFSTHSEAAPTYGARVTFNFGGPVGPR